MFDIRQFKNLTEAQSRYSRRINALHSAGVDTSHIERTVTEATDNLKSGSKSFVIYGEPQSGKTEMMIALTSKLLDEGHKIIIVLLNDNVPLLSQNLNRFRVSGIDPTPVDITYILEKEIGDKRWIIFCKKNIRDLVKLIDKLHNKKDKVIIDDEADYASPNAKVNRDERTAVNHCVYKLLGNDGIYIGVTATPARLDLNNTFDNVAENWICFNSHDEYVGKDTFFPMDMSKSVDYRLRLLSDKGDDPKYLQKALLSFFTNVAYINIHDDIKKLLGGNDADNVSFTFLIHTSGRIADHEKDERVVNKLLDILTDDTDKDYDKLVELLYNTAVENHGRENVDEIVKFVIKNIRREFGMHPVRTGLKDKL